MDSLELPSKITAGRYFITMPQQEKVVDDDEEWNRCGKWLWFSQGNTELHDHVWKELQPLLSNKILIMIKASTAAMTHERGMISCFTKPEKEAIKRAAKAIRDVTKDGHFLYYKENRLTQKNIDHRKGHKKISAYMYTAKGRFYRRDRFQRWILDEDRATECQLAFIQNIGNSGLEHLPSNSNKDNHHLKHSEYFEKSDSTGWWNIMCDNSDRDECGRTEADKVWITTHRLYEKNTFQRIAYLRKPQVAYISCYVTDFSNIQSLLASVKEVMESAPYANPVYFYVYSIFHGKKTWKYQFTAEGELYERSCYDKYKYDQFIIED